MKIKLMMEEVKIPNGLAAAFENNVLTVKGPKGELKKKLLNKRVDIETKDGRVIFSSANGTKRQKTAIGSFKAHVKNMFNGVAGGHAYKLRICSGHFPMNVSVSGKEFVIKNFLGEKIPRVLRLKDDVAVKVDGTDVVVTSISKELAGQAAADIEKLTAVKGRDNRVFQDGIYIIEKDGKKIE